MDLNDCKDRRHCRDGGSFIVLQKILLMKKKALATIRNIVIEGMKPVYSGLRLHRAGDIQSMVNSLKHQGQLQLVTVHVQEEFYCIIDGVKRYHAALELSWETLECQVFDVDASLAKAMILHLNKSSRSLSDYEEGLIVQSIKQEQGLDQKAISELLGRSRSWVCRRLSLVEKLCETVQDSMKMGVISGSMAREIIKLPRGNQEEILKSITEHQLTSRQSALIVEKFLKAASKEEKHYILTEPMDIIEKDQREEDIHDSRLSGAGNRLLKSAELHIKGQNILKSQLLDEKTRRLEGLEQQIIQPKLERVKVQGEKINHLITSIYKIK